ncbi:MAG: ABC transporter permease subunit [Clostridia bacterium]|nr:ABC transporter permease subunit [Clostridia bacterium]
MSKVISKKEAKERGIGKTTWKQDFKDNGVVYLLFLVPFIFLFIFNYVPMVWLLMAFEDFSFQDGLGGSEWVWFDNFARLFSNEQFWLAFRNTVCMALINLVFGFFFPLVLALLISEVRIKWFKRTVQPISFLPYFISTVVVCMMFRFMLDEGGAITQILGWFGVDDQNLLTNDKVPVFWLINGFIEVWQKAGYNSIMFVAVLATIDGDLLEASSIDGANRWTRMFKIKLPNIMPFVLTMLTLNVGMIFMQGFDKILLLYNNDILSVADCMQTFTYRYSFTGSNPDYALSTAAGLFQSIIATILMIFSQFLQGRMHKKSNNL